MSTVVNTVANVPFLLRQFDGTPITGAVYGDFDTSPIAKLLPTGVITIVPTITEIGSGWYTAVFTPTSVGDWLYYHVYDADNDWSEDVEVVSAAASDTIPALATGFTQLGDIRSAVARICDDWLEIEATEASSDTTIWIDSTNLYENDEHFRGSELLVHGSIINGGLRARVISSSRGTFSISLGSGLSGPPQSGDIGWLFNIGGEGEPIRSYDAVINDAIKSLGRSAYALISRDLADVWDRTVSWADIPTDFRGVYAVYYDDVNGNIVQVPSQAWDIDVVRRKITIDPSIGDIANGYTVHLSGRGAVDRLSLDSDATGVDFDWLVKESAAQILLRKRDQLMVNRGGMMKNEADGLRGNSVPFSMIENMIWLD